MFAHDTVGNKTFAFFSILIEKLNSSVTHRDLFFNIPGQDNNFYKLFSNRESEIFIKQSRFMSSCLKKMLEN